MQKAEMRNVISAFLLLGSGFKVQGSRGGFAAFFIGPMPGSGI